MALLMRARTPFASTGESSARSNFCSLEAKRGNQKKSCLVVASPSCHEHGPAALSARNYAMALSSARYFSASASPSTEVRIWERNVRKMFSPEIESSDECAGEEGRRARLYVFDLKSQ